MPRGTSGGSGVSVAANLATCSICEQGSASCKGPASRNNIVNLLTTKGILMDGGIGQQDAGDRAGIHCRTVEDAALVLDAIKGFESGDMFTAIPKGMIPKEPYASFVVTDADVTTSRSRACASAIVREFMVKHTKNDVAISDQIDKEIKTVLRDKLGAELVESVDPLYPDDPAVPNMKYTFQDAFAEILPHNVPGIFLAEDGVRRTGVRRARLGCDDRRLCRRAGAGQGAAVGEAESAPHQRSGLANPRARSR